MPAKGKRKNNPQEECDDTTTAPYIDKRIPDHMTEVFKVLASRIAAAATATTPKGSNITLDTAQAFWRLNKVMKYTNQPRELVMDETLSMCVQGYDNFLASETKPRAQTTNDAQTQTSPPPPPPPARTYAEAATQVETTSEKGKGKGKRPAPAATKGATISEKEKGKEAVVAGPSTSRTHRQEATRAPTSQAPTQARACSLTRGPHKVQARSNAPLDRGG